MMFNMMSALTEDRPITTKLADRRYYEKILKIRASKTHTILEKLTKPGQNDKTLSNPVNLINLASMSVYPLSFIQLCHYLAL